MKRLLYSFFILLNGLSFAENSANAYYVKCTIKTVDKSLNGFIHVPHEILPDSILIKYKQSNEFLTKHLTTGFKVNNLEVYSFVYLYEFVNSQNEVNYAPYRSEDKIYISVSDIEKVEYLDLISYTYSGKGVSSKLSESDLSWLSSRALTQKTIVDKSDCCNNIFLIHDLNVNYDEIIQQVVESKDAEWQDLVNKLRNNKVVLLTDCNPCY